MSLQITSFDAELVCLIQEKRQRDEVISVIKKRNLYNVIDDKGNTLLHRSAHSKNTEIVKYLIGSGSLIDVQNDRENTPLMLAIEKDCKETVELLVVAGANVFLKNSSGRFVLEMIGKYDRASEKTLRFLSEKLENDCSNDKEVIAQKLSDANWTLHNVVGLRDATLTRMMLQRGLTKNIDALNCYNQSALHVAVKCCDDENVKVLLENNASVNVMDSLQQIPLSYVYYHNNNDYTKERLNIIKMLLDRETFRGSGHPESLRAALDIFECGSREAVKLLLQAHTNLFATDSARLAAVSALVSNKDPSVIMELRGKGFLVDLSDGDGTVILMKAAIHGVHTVEFLIKYVADIKYDARGQKSARLLAAVMLYCVTPESEEEYRECVQLILVGGADVQMEILYRQKNFTIFNVILSKEYLVLGDLVLAHLALREALGEPIDESNLSKINSSNELFAKFDSNRLLLPTEICESVTLLELLTVSEIILEQYTYKEGFDSQIQGVFRTLKGHYYYSTLLQKRLTNIKLKKRAARVISRIMKMSYDSFPRIVDDIISYLDCEDLENVLNASL